MASKLELIKEMEETRKVSLIEQEIERYDIIGSNIACNPLKIKEDIFSKICFRLSSLENNREISFFDRKYAEEVMNFYRDISFYRLQEVLKLNKKTKNAS